jgi:glycosyltransferase involved in cell wall biosynthesis
MEKQNRLGIGLIHWTFPPTTGGVESHLADLSRLLSQAGCTVTVITGEPVPIEHPEYTVVSSHLLNLDWVRANTPEKTGYSRALHAELGALIAEHHLDVIHGHNLHHFAPEPALVLEELRTQLGFRIHHTFHETWPDMLHDSPVYQRWNGNYAVSQFVQRQCDERLGYRPQLLPLGIDLELFRGIRPAFAAGSTPIILHPARLLPWKGVHLSVRMLAELRKQGFEAKLVLTDAQRITDWNQELNAYREEILALISTLDLRERVEFRSVVYAEMPALYNEADIVIYPTIGEEPYGLVPLEAMSCQRPIVATRSGGITETVLDGRTGYVVDCGDVSALTERVSRLLTNPALAQRFGAAGRQHVQQYFDIKQYISILIDYYKSL